MDFDTGFDFDFSCLDDEDFGLAKSFTTAPIGLVAPEVSLASAEQTDLDKECENALNRDPVGVEGFNFKLHPVEDQVQFQRDLKDLAPKMTDFAKGTTTLAFEF
jgi:hypothetical protein